MRAKVHVLTNIPTYHQVDLFDEIASLGEVDVFVTYLRGTSPGRQWSRLPTPRHPHRMMPVRWADRSYYVNPGLSRHISDIDADLLVVAQYSALAYQEAMIRAGLSGRPFVFWSEAAGVRFFEVKSRLPAIVGRVARWAAQLPIRAFAKEIWAIGGRASTYYSSLASCPVRSMPYVSHLARFDRGENPVAAGDRVRLLFAGRLSYRKGFDVVLEAARALEGRQDLRGRWTLTVCGDGDLRSELAHLRNVEYLGFQELEQMPSVMARHDVFLAPSRYDGWGMVVPEALAAGMTVISTRETGSAEAIGAQPFLHLVAPGDSAGLAHCLAELIEAPERLRANAPLAAVAAMQYDAAAGARLFSSMAMAVLEGRAGA